MRDDDSDNEPMETENDVPASPIDNEPTIKHITDVQTQCLVFYSSALTIKNCLLLKNNKSS